MQFRREDLLRELKGQFGVGSAVHYPAVWSWEVFRTIDHDKFDCPMAEKACAQVFSLPIFPDTPLEDLDYIRMALVESIHELRRKNG